MVIIPTQDNVVIKFPKQKEKEQISKGGIFLGSAPAPESQEFGEVVAVGTGRTLLNGEKIKTEVAVGDKIIFNKFAGTKISDEENDYLIIKENDILAIVR